MFHRLRAQSMVLAGISFVSLMSGCVTTSAPWSFGRSAEAEVIPAQNVLPAAYAPAQASPQAAAKYSPTELASWKRGAGGLVGYASSGAATNCHS